MKNSRQLNQHWLPCVYFAVFSQKLNHYNFPGNKSSARRLFFLWRKTSFLVWINRSDNSTRPTGSVWTTRTVIPPGKHKRPRSPPQLPSLRAITSDCGHKVSLQTFLKDGASCWLRWTSWVYCYGNCSRTNFNTKATIGIKITDRGLDGGYISECVQGKVFWLIQSLKELRLNTKSLFQEKRSGKNNRNGVLVLSWRTLHMHNVPLCAVGKRCTWRHEIWGHLLWYCQKVFFPPIHLNLNAVMNIQRDTPITIEQTPWWIFWSLNWTHLVAADMAEWPSGSSSLSLHLHISIE